MGDIDFSVISAAENSNKFQKTRFWNEKSVDDVVTLGPMAQATLVWCKVSDDAMCIAFILGYYMIYEIIKIIFSNHKNIKLISTIKLYICRPIPYIYIIALLILIYSLLVCGMWNI